MDHAFQASPDTPHAKPFAYSATRACGQPRWMIWADADTTPPAPLLAHRTALLARRARAFHAQNWWHWIRKPPAFLTRPAVLVNAKTRHPFPFYAQRDVYVEGTLFALFPKNPEMDADCLAERLNRLDWADLGFKSGGRHLFGQRTLTHLPLPDGF